MSGILLDHFPPYILRQSLSMEPRAHRFDFPTSQFAPQIPYLPPKFLMVTMPSSVCVCACLGSQFKFPNLISKHFYLLNHPLQLQKVIFLFYKSTNLFYEISYLKAWKLNIEHMPVIGWAIDHRWNITELHFWDNICLPWYKPSELNNCIWQGLLFLT